MTHPIITKKVAEFENAFNWAEQLKDSELERWKIMYGFTPSDLKAFLIQAMQEMYEAGKRDGVTEHDAQWHPINDKMQMENLHIRAEAQRETAKEILKMLADRQTRMVQPLYEINPTASPSIEDLISSKYLADSPKNETA